MSTLSFIVIGSDVVVSVVVASVVVGPSLLLLVFEPLWNVFVFFVCVFVIAIVLTVANVNLDVCELQASSAQGVEGEREGGMEEKKKATVRSVPDGSDNQLIWHSF